MQYCFLLGTSPGRPVKSFDLSSERSKRRKTQDLRLKDVGQLTYATQMKLRKAGKTLASKIVKELSESPTRAKKYVSALKKVSTENTHHQLSPLSALSMFTEAGLTRSQYEIIRATNKAFFPSYSVLQRAKKECYPKPEAYNISSTCAEIELQQLLDHTASRLIEDLHEPINSLSEEEKKTLVLVSKWGCDGSQ